MSNRLPIETTIEGEKITKVCVEDVHKFLNRIIDPVNDSYSKIINILDSCHQEYGDYEGELIVGRGASQPCENDKFDEEIGNEIAFRKAKLNANIKKFKLLVRILRALDPINSVLADECIRLEKYIANDINSIRKYNKDYRGEKFDKNGYLYKELCL